MRLNLFLLLIIAGLSVFGSIIPQGEDPAFYLYTYGSLRANFIMLFGLDDVFHSWWFFVLVFLLTTSLLACSLKRLKPLWRQAATFQYYYEDDFYSGASNKGQVSCSKNAAETAGLLLQRLRRRRYRVFAEEKQGRFFFYADRGRLGPLGSLVTHLSMVVIVLGALYGGLAGFKSYADIPEGETYFVEKAGFYVRLNDFHVDYYDGYMPRQYYSDLKVIDGNQEVVSKTISVNDPLTYRGVNFYQTSYGWVVDGIFSNFGEESRFAALERKSTPLSGDYKIKTIFYPDFADDGSGYPRTSSPLPNNPMVGYVIYQGPKALKYDIAELGSPVKINDSITVTFTGYRQYTGLQIAKDPGMPVVYSGLALVMLGLFLSFYIFPRRIWAKITPASGGCRVLLAGAASRFPVRLAEDIRELEEGLKENGFKNGKEA